MNLLVTGRTNLSLAVKVVNIQRYNFGPQEIHLMPEKRRESKSPSPIIGRLNNNTLGL